MRIVDRRGTLVADVRWRPDGTLARAWARVPDGTWLAVEPRAACGAPWGDADRVWHWPRAADAPPLGADALPPDAVPLTLGEALDWARIARIPVLAEPARLPPGGGAAVLNLIAALAELQGTRRLVYTGPFPGEQLFLTLLESFRYEPAHAPDPLAAFAAGGLAWAPAPHEALVAADGLWVQRRGRVEKVVWRGTTYLRPDWQGVVRHAPRRVRDAGDGVRCGLWALGRSLADHLLLAPSGELVRVLDEDTPADTWQRALPRRVWTGVVAAVAAESAPPLAPFIRAVARDVTLGWGRVARDLVRVEAARVIVDDRLRAALADGVRAAARPAERAGVALAALAELAQLAGDALRARAQAALAALDAPAQAAALRARAGAAAGPEGAREIVGGAAALLADAVTTSS